MSLLPTNELVCFVTLRNEVVEGRGLIVNGDVRFLVFHNPDSGERVDDARGRALCEWKARKALGIPNHFAR